MGRKSKKKVLTQQPVGSAVTPRRGRMLMAFAALFVASAAVTYEAAKFFTRPSIAHIPAVEIIKGDGIRGPVGTVWVPGGEFLMGSDHKLAQRNERPAHKVRVHGSGWTRHMSPTPSSPRL